MNIRTLGDLTRTTEAALLSSKNFGETSLAEIKEMMQAKGLRLGMALEGGERAAHDHRIEPTQEVPPEMQAMLAKPIGDLNLSVRARKCMSKLSIQTVGDLLKHTGDELLECKNFGVTSLNEVRDKLTAHGPQAQERLTAGRPRGLAGPVGLRQPPPASAPIRAFRGVQDYRLDSSASDHARRHDAPPVRFTVHVPRPGLGRADGPAGDAARHAGDAGLHAGRHPGDGQGADPRPASRHRDADDPGQHLPPGPAARRGRRGRDRRAASRSWAGTARS